MAEPGILLAATQATMSYVWAILATIFVTLIIQNLVTGEMIDIRPDDLEFARLPPLPPGTEIADVEVVIRLRQRT